MISVILENLEKQINDAERASIFKSGLKIMLSNYASLVQSYINETLKGRIDLIPHLYLTDEQKRKVLESDSSQYALKLQDVLAYKKEIDSKESSLDIHNHKEWITCYDVSFCAHKGYASVFCLFRIADTSHPLVQKHIMPFVSLIKFVYTSGKEDIPLIDIQSRPLYYYTNAANAIDDFKNGHIYVSKIWEVNDPNEWIANLLDKRGESIGFDNAEKQARDAFRRSLGMVSLSKSWDIAPMWGQYADKFTGAVLEVNIDPAMVSEVIYAEKSDNLRANIPQNEYATQFQKVCSRKSADWSYEQECRWILPLTPSVCFLRGGNYFTSMGIGSNHYGNGKPQITLKSIICGPKMSPAQIDQLRFIKIGNKLKTPIYKAKFKAKSYGLDKETYC